MDEITEEQGQLLVIQAQSLKVVDRTTYTIMAGYVLTLRKAKKFFEDRARPRIEEAHKHWKNMLADLQKDIAPIEKAQRYGDQELATYDREQERIARLEQLRQEAEAKKRDELERKQLAELAKKAGDKELAKEIANAPSSEPVVYVPKATPKVEGLSYREDFKFEITDASKLPREYLIPDESKIGKIVRALKQTTSIPGVRVYLVKVPVGKA